MRLTKTILTALTLLVTTNFAQAVELKVDGVHSSLVFRIQHMGFAHVWGMIPMPEGKIVWDSADPTKSTFDVTAKLANISTHNQKRDQHLKGPDFFDAKQFPTMNFKSTSVKKTGENTFEVAGDLTMRGTTKPVTVTLTQGAVQSAEGKTATGFDGSFKINRNDFGVSYGQGSIGDEVEIFVALEAKQGE